MITKKDVINEILRKVRILTQTKYDETDDKLLKKLLAEDLASLSELSRS